MGLGGLLSGNAASRAKRELRQIADTPGLDIGASIAEARRYAPETQALESQRNTFNRAELDRGRLEMVDKQIDTATGTKRLKATFDHKERKLWPEYQKAYEDAIRRTSTKHAPWYVIPSNHKWFRNLAVSNIIVDTLKSLDMQFPEPTVDLAKIRQQYHAEEEEQGGDSHHNKKS